MASRRLAVLLWLLSACVAAARADEVAGREQARMHFRAGTVFYEAGSYDAAIREYESAYKLAPLPDLLFNLAQAHRLAGHARAAAGAYRRYLELRPTGVTADQARQLLSEVEVAATAAPLTPATSAAPLAPTSAAPLPPTLAEPLPPTLVAPALVAAPSPALQLTAAPARRRPVVYKQWWLWTATALAAGGIATGVALAVSRPREASFQVHAP